MFSLNGVQYIWNQVRPQKCSLLTGYNISGIGIGSKGVQFEWDTIYLE